MRMIESLKRTVGFLYFKEGSKYMPLDTASFAKVREENHEFEYLITCKHVVEACPRHSQVFLRLNNQDLTNVKYIPLPDNWVYHKDRSVDLAVIRYNHLKDIPCDYEAVDTEFVFLPDALLRQYITEGDPVAFIGLFTKVMGKRRNLPIYRYGHVAMVTNEKINNKKYGPGHYLLVECEAYPGNSGAPLYVSIPRQVLEDIFGFSDVNPRQNYVFVLGIMTATFLEQEIYIPEQKKKTTHNSRISLVVPINYVRDILHGDILLDDRKRHVVDDTPGDDNPILVSASPDEQNNRDDDNPFSRKDFFDALNKVAKPIDDNED